jgi:thiol-disulfide isomerase/thioredoxin
MPSSDVRGLLRRWLVRLAIGVVPLAGCAGRAPTALPARSHPFELPESLLTSSGTSVELSELRGEVGTVIVFTAAWCHTCAALLADLARRAERDRDRGVKVVVVAVDADRALGGELTDSLGTADMPALLADPDARRAFRLQGLVPTTILLDRVGRTVRRWDGQIELLALDATVPRLEGYGRTSPARKLARR